MVAFCDRPARARRSGIDERVCLRVRRQHPLHLGPQRRLPVARAVEERLPLGRRPIERRLEQAANSLEVVRSDRPDPTNSGISPASRMDPS